MCQIKFIKGSLKFNKREAIVRIPLSLAKELYKNAGGNCDTYLAVVNGILQVSPKIPDLAIPMIQLKPEFFIAQKDDKH